MKRRDRPMLPYKFIHPCIQHCSLVATVLSLPILLPMRVGLHHLSLWWAGFWSGVWLLRKGLCYDSIVGSVVECLPATRAARV